MKFFVFRRILCKHTNLQRYDPIISILKILSPSSVICLFAIRVTSPWWRSTVDQYRADLLCLLANANTTSVSRHDRENALENSRALIFAIWSGSFGNCPNPNPPFHKHQIDMRFFDTIIFVFGRYGIENVFRTFSDELSHHVQID